jgi:hypothetical protein
MLLSFDVVADAIVEHDDWHTHEHLPERLSIPGFMRGSRWVAARDHPRYLVIYEVEQLATLTSDAYLQRLNTPTPWTAKIMPHYRDMSRGFCSVTCSVGPGIGGFCLLVTFKPAQGVQSSLREWLRDELLPGMAGRPGLGSCHLLEGAVTPGMTNEQRIRGADAAVDWALVVTGYSEQALAELAQPGFMEAQLARRGAVGARAVSYQLAYSLDARELASA